MADPSSHASLRVRLSPWLRPYQSTTVREQERRSLNRAAATDPRGAGPGRPRIRRRRLALAAAGRGAAARAARAEVARRARRSCTGQTLHRTSASKRSGRSSRRRAPRWRPYRISHSATRPHWCFETTSSRPRPKPAAPAVLIPEGGPPRHGCWLLIGAQKSSLVRRSFPQEAKGSHLRRGLPLPRRGGTTATQWRKAGLRI